MGVKKTANGWLVDIQPGGRGAKRLRKTFRTQAEAKNWEVWVKSNTNNQADWMPEKKDLRRLDELAVTMFNELIRLGVWKRDNPLKDLRQFKVQENELSYLTKEQIAMLLVELKKSINPHMDLVSRICLATGARWSEAEQLQPQQVRQRLIQFARTKTGKARAVPISQDMQDEIFTHHEEHRNMGAMFTSCTGAFKEAIERADIQLPMGQLTHVLRHTFASHFMINGGNILALQRILGHQDLKTTMLYAHLAPEHLDTARTLNPLMIC